MAGYPLPLSIYGLAIAGSMTSPAAKNGRGACLNHNIYPTPIPFFN